MTVNALIRMGVVWMRNVRLNRAKRSYRQFLISNISNPVPLKPVDLKSGFHQLGLLRLQQFNTWHFGEHKFTILERSHPKIYAKLLKKKAWNSITQNNTGAAIAHSGPNITTGAQAVHQEASNKSIAIAGCLLTGFEFAEQWLQYYLKCPEVRAVYWYVNAPVAPASFVEMTKRYPQVHLIPWDFDFFKRKNHYLNTYQPGHALPAAYADSKYRALSEGHSHLLHIDLDEYIYPLSGLSAGCINKPVHFLNAYGSSLTFNGQGLDQQTTHFLDVTDSLGNSSSGVGTSGNASAMSYGKSVAPLRLDAVAPDNHCVPIPTPDDLTISSEAVMLHFLDMEGTRNYKSDVTKLPLSRLDLSTYTQAHWKRSQSFTEKYAVYQPLVVSHRKSPLS